MAEQAKTASTPAAQEQAYPASTIVQYPHQAYNGASFPPPGPPGYMPPFFSYPPPDGAHPEGQNSTVSAPPYMMALPPGVVYAYPPPQAPGFASSPSSTTPAALTRPKRKQVKMACTNCASACKRCDENRPCERCIKYGTPDTCVDGVRKERKKGVKRGPYKRKNKDQMDSGSLNGDFTPGTSTVTTTAAIHAAAPYVPEGYYPVYYPPPGAFMPHGPDGQPTADGSPPHANGQPPMIPYVIHPGFHPPFPHYPPIYPHQAAAPASAPAPQPGAHAPANTATATQSPNVITGGPGHPAPQPQVQEPHQITTVNPADTARKPDEAGEMNLPVVDPALNGKKRTRTTKSGEPKSKKLKTNGTTGRVEDKSGEMGVEPSAIMNGSAEGGHGA
ncbi:hypothetical protein CPB83DRAFT_868665 [Crepidotus variabilis]|uniref:Transcription activator of gluconeogenesis ERT1 n=1 Tax=Crepidotus variabilis TaxID=179855 RepID=A0A9P6EJU6_9AGAR|nr:hypothetical protein CPB83DRAFT_868665 [Crepidotus variabilis]